MGELCGYPNEQRNERGLDLELGVVILIITRVNNLGCGAGELAFPCIPNQEAPSSNKPSKFERAEGLGNTKKGWVVRHHPDSELRRGPV